MDAKFSVPCNWRAWCRQYISQIQQQLFFNCLLESLWNLSTLNMFLISRFICLFSQNWVVVFFSTQGSWLKNNCLADTRLAVGFFISCISKFTLAAARVQAKNMTFLPHFCNFTQSFQKIFYHLPINYSVSN